MLRVVGAIVRDEAFFGNFRYVHFHPTTIVRS